MTSNSLEKPKTVEGLNDFPFETFTELQTNVTTGTANIGVDRSVALQWIQDGIYSTPRQRKGALLMASMMFIVPIGLLVYIVMTGSWWLLVSLPFLVIAYFMLHPSSGPALGPLRTLLIAGTFGGLAYGYVYEISWLTALTVCLAVLWFSQKSVYGRAVDGMIQAALKHEDLFCILWNGNSLNVTLSNGDSYWGRWRTISGETTHYDLDNNS